MDIDSLWTKYSKTKDKEIKKALIENYIDLVKIVSGRMYNFYGSKIEYEDLLGYGILGLIDSIEKFDITKNIKFETYAQIRIKGAIIDSIRKLDWVPRSLRKKSKDVQNTIQQLENKLGRTPTNEEIAESLNISVKELENILSDISTFNVASLEDLILSNGDFSSSFQQETNKPEEIYENKELKEILIESINNLTENEKLVISLYYYEELTYKEIGHIMELSESRISQIHSKAILKIKNYLKKKGIDENFWRWNMYNINRNISLNISKDGLKGYIIISKDENEELLDFNVNDVVNEVKKYFKYGLKEDLLLSVLNNKIINEKVLIAEGKKPVNGKDGSIKYYIDFEKPLLPKINPDGTVDYKELDSINVVKAGDILAEIIPPEKGEDGIKVDGDPILHKKGKTPIFSRGKNTIVSEDGLFLKSSSDGIVEYRNGKISVSEILILDRVDNSTGNINFNGNVIINKDILNGLTLKTTGSVEIKGAVEGGYVQCDGDLLVRRGIQGYNRKTIDIGGNLSTKFIENSIINAGGNITSEAIMHSDVSSKANILVIGRKGLIVGGVCRAKFEIRAKVVGSSMATSTVLEVGVDPELKLRCDKLEKKIKELKDNIDKIEKSLKVLELLKSSNKLDQKKAMLYNNLLRAKDSISREILNLEMDLEKAQHQRNSLSKGQIKVADTVYPGVKIIIGNSQMLVKDEMKRCTFYEEDGRIKVGPY